jgi:KDO2-lipid IV(A) lauroyltransferase
MGKVVFIAAWLISRLSLRNVGRLATGLTWLLFDVLRVRRGLVLKNLELAFPHLSDKDRIHIGRTSVRNFALTTLEFLHSYRSDIAAQVTMIGTEHLRRVLARGQGAYILCCHVGNWEAMGAAMTRHVTPAYVLVKKVGGKSVNDFVSALREKNGFLAVKREKKGDGFKGIQAILGRGEVVGFVMDQARPGEPKLPFFGVPAKTNTSFAAIWRRHPAPIIPAYIVRHGVGEHTLYYMPELCLTQTDDAAADILRHSIEFNGVVETIVRKHPEHYFWMHNRWK